MRILKQNETDATFRRVFFVVVDSATAKVFQTGKAGGLDGFLTKKGATPVALAGNFVEVHATNQPGRYYYQATVGELDTIGRLVFRFTCTDCLERTIVTHVGVTREDLNAAISASEANIRGADSDDLKTLSDQTDAVPTAAEIDAQLSGVHGGGSWQAVGPGEGANAVDVTVVDSVSLSPIPAVQIQVRNLDESVLLAAQETDGNGEAGFLLDDGTYKVRLRKLGSYTFNNPETLIVSGPTSETFQGTAFSPSTPPTPETCVVSGVTHDTGDNPISVEIVADLVEPKKFTTGKIQIIKQARTVSSAALDGYWEIVLTRSAEYTATSVKYSFKIGGRVMGEYLIPDQDNVEFADLPENAP